MIPKASDRLAQHGTPSATLNAFSRAAISRHFDLNSAILNWVIVAAAPRKCLPCSDRAGCKLSAALYAL
jgi:hypothetical protein